VEHVRLIEAADLSFAIILSSDGRVMDGIHRVAKAVLLGELPSKLSSLPMIPSRITLVCIQINSHMMRPPMNQATSPNHELDSSSGQMKS
jgi:hypothetical protein